MSNDPIVIAEPEMTVAEQRASQNAVDQYSSDNVQIFRDTDVHMSRRGSAGQ